MTDQTQTEAQAKLNEEFQAGHRPGDEAQGEQNGHGDDGRTERDPHEEMQERHLGLVAAAKQQQNFQGPDHTKPPELRALELNNSLLGAMLELMHLGHR